MIKTTTSTIQNKNVREYLGIVSGETVSGVNFVKDIFSSIRDIIGCRSNTYERELIKAREAAISEMEAKAVDLGANAILGIDVDYEVLGKNNGMLMVTVTGTAVIVE